MGEAQRRLLVAVKRESGPATRQGASSKNAPNTTREGAEPGRDVSVQIFSILRRVLMGESEQLGLFSLILAHGAQLVPADKTS